jgi:hypothetical protein
MDPFLNKTDSLYFCNIENMAISKMIGDSQFFINFHPIVLLSFIIIQKHILFFHLFKRYSISSHKVRTDDKNFLKKQLTKDNVRCYIINRRWD